MPPCAIASERLISAGLHLLDYQRSQARLARESTPVPALFTQQFQGAAILPAHHEQANTLVEAIVLLVMPHVLHAVVFFTIMITWQSSRLGVERLSPKCSFARFSGPFDPDVTQIKKIGTHNPTLPFCRKPSPDL